MSKYYNNKFFLFLLIFPFFNPMSFKYIPSLVALYDAVQVWKLVAILVIMVSYCMRKKFSPVVGIVCAYSLLSVIMSLANGVAESKIFTNALLYIGISMLTEIAVNVNFKQFFKVFFAITLFFCAVNVIMCFLYPDGLTMATLYQNKANPLYFLAVDNGMINALLPAVFMAFFESVFLNKRMGSGSKTGRWRTLVVTLLLCWISLSIVRSATGMIVYLAVVTIMLLSTFKVKWRIPYRILIGFLAVFMLLVVIMGTGFDFVTVIAEWFGRESTFTGRTLLWAKAIEMILNRPFMGYGYTEGNIKIWGGSYSTHNLFLEMALQGGLLLLGVFIVLVAYALHRNRKADIPYANTISMAIFSYLMVGLMEITLSPFFFMFLVLACYPDLRTDVPMKKLVIR